jgi:hypothetical protein
MIKPRLRRSVPAPADAVMQTRSRTLEIPSGLSLPLAFGICTRLIGSGRSSAQGYDRDLPDDAHGCIAAYRSVKPPPRSALSCDSSLTSDPRISFSRCRTIAVIATRSAAV